MRSFPEPWARGVDRVHAERPATCAPSLLNMELPKRHNLERQPVSSNAKFGHLSSATVCPVSSTVLGELMEDSLLANLIQDEVRAQGQEPLALARADYHEEAPNHRYSNPDAAVVATETAVIVVNIAKSVRKRTGKPVRISSTSEYTEISNVQIGTIGSSLGAFRFVRERLEITLMNVYKDPQWNTVMDVVRERLLSPSSDETPERPGIGEHSSAQVTEASPAAEQEGPSSARADWYPDPLGRHQQRYWDGSSWTDHVADEGTQGTDPIEGSFAAVAQAARERLGTDASMNVDASGWLVMDLSHHNREEYKTTGELMLDIYEDSELWLSQTSELVLVVRTRTVTVASMMSSHSVDTLPAREELLGGLEFEGRAGLEALEAALSQLKDGQSPELFDATAKKGARGRRSGFWGRLSS